MVEEKVNKIIHKVAGSKNDSLIRGGFLLGFGICLPFTLNTSLDVFEIIKILVNIIILLLGVILINIGRR